MPIFSVRATDAAANTDPTPASRLDDRRNRAEQALGASRAETRTAGWCSIGRRQATTSQSAPTSSTRTGALLQTLGASARSADVGPYRMSDRRRFQVAARDTAGNVGKKTQALVLVPKVAKLTVSNARARLEARASRPE